nr:methyltransferase domain-containing protein [Caldimonas mangrovi]
MEQLVRKHLATAFRRPPAAYSRQAFDTLVARGAGHRPLVLDSACGTGESTAALARRHPEALVVGVDQSEERIERGRRKLGGVLPGNALLLRADVTDIWALLEAQGLRLTHHYLLYPNPWPKSEHLQRRWHGHPRFRELLALGGHIELRTNWRLYAEEFEIALRCAGWRARCTDVNDAEPLTPFERKYRDSGHPLSRLVAQAGNTPVDR